MRALMQAAEQDPFAGENTRSDAAHWGRGKLLQAIGISDSLARELNCTLPGYSKKLNEVSKLVRKAEAAFAREDLSARPLQCSPERACLEDAVGGLTDAARLVGGMKLETFSQMKKDLSQRNAPRFYLAMNRHHSLHDLANALKHSVEVLSLQLQRTK